MRQLAPGVYRLQTPMGSTELSYVCPYAFVANGRVTLFDTGYDTPEAREALTQELAAIGCSLADVERIYVSHAHADHLGLVAWLTQQVPGCELVMHEAEWRWFEQTHHALASSMDAQAAWLLRHGVPMSELEEARRENEREQAASDDVATETQRRWWAAERVEPGLLLRDGDSFAIGEWEFQAVWTPGHTPGHLCLYEQRQRLLLTGDHILSRITPNVSLNAEDEASGRSPLAEYLASVKKVRSLDVALALPAHEETIDDLPERCDFLLAHHERRMVEVLAGLGTGATAREVSARVTWNKPFETFGIYKRRSALGETLSHLQLLADGGHIRRIDGDLVRWEPV